jgi:ATP-dependent DNA helicase
MRLFAGDHLVVSAPTSSGKTMIGELAALRAHLRGERTYMLLPLRALVNDKYEDLRQKYDDVGLRVIRSTGEIADDNDALMRGKFDIALLTYERFTALAVTAPFLLRNVGLIVVDELQMIADEGRGANLEFLLTYLRAQRVIGVEPQLVALSAVIGDTNRFEQWLGARLLFSTKRPVPLEEGTVDRAGTFHYLSRNRRQRTATGQVRHTGVPERLVPRHHHSSGEAAGPSRREGDRISRYQVDRSIDGVVLGWKRGITCSHGGPRSSSGR